MGVHMLAEALGPTGGAAGRSERPSKCRVSRLAAHERSRLRWKEAPDLALSADALPAWPRWCSWCANERWWAESGGWPGGPQAGSLDASSGWAVG